MSVLKDCWANIVGYTRLEECVDDINRPIDFDVSLSGIYLDELRGINLNMIEDTGGELWIKLRNAYENAIRTFKVDVFSEILKNHKNKYDNFVGNIGSQRFKNSLSLTKNYAGIRMYCNDIKGGYFTLKAIGVLMDKTETFDIDIFDNLTDEPIETIEVNSIENKISIKNLDTPIVLQLSNDNYDNMEYFFLYNRGVKQPKNNKPTCSCGDVRWCFNAEHPCFADAKATKERWRQFAMVGGIQGDDISSREDWGISQEMYGIVLIGEFNCDKYAYFCNSSMDFEEDEIGQAVANAIAYKWGEYAMDFFLDTQEISRFTALGLEAINNNRDFYNSRYNVMINFISENLDSSKLGCLSCRPNQNARFNKQLL
jgi:hypothetical protein